MSPITRITATTAHLGNSAKPYNGLLVNVFPILNTEELTCAYRRWEVFGLSPDDKEFERNRVTLRLQVSRDVQGPAEVLQEGEHLLVIVPEGYKDPKPVYSLAPYVVNLKPLRGRGEVDFSSSDASSQLLATRFLQSALSDKLWHSKELWQPRAGRPFFFKRPANADDPSRRVDVFEGFSFRIVWVGNVPQQLR